MGDWVTWLDRRLASPYRTGAVHQRMNDRLIALREWLADRESVTDDEILTHLGEPITAARRARVRNDLGEIGWRKIRPHHFVPCAHELGEIRQYCKWCWMTEYEHE